MHTAHNESLLMRQVIGTLHPAWPPIRRNGVLTATLPVVANKSPRMVVDQPVSMFSAVASSASIGSSRNWKVRHVLTCGTLSERGMASNHEISTASLAGRSKNLWSLCRTAMLYGLPLRVTKKQTWTSPSI
jgi:hypothetical protein